MKALYIRLTQTTGGLIGQVLCNHEDHTYIRIDIIFLKTTTIEWIGFILWVIIVYFCI